jgi:hypothetical protein
MEITEYWYSVRTDGMRLWSTCALLGLKVLIQCMKTPTFSANMHILTLRELTEHNMQWWESHLPKGSTSSGALSSIWSNDVLALAERGAGSSLNQAT